MRRQLHLQSPGHSKSAHTKQDKIIIYEFWLKTHLPLISFLLLPVELLVVGIQADVPVFCSSHELFAVQGRGLGLDHSIVDHEMQTGDL